MEIWQFQSADVWQIERIAAAAEEDQWDGLFVTDSQNLSPDTYVTLTLAARATSRIKLGPGVTNPVTRHAAVTAGAIASLQEISGGRAVLGIGRGDSALFNIGYEPASPSAFRRYLATLQSYLSGDAVDCNGYDSRLRWLERSDQAKVPVDVAATGPKVILLASQLAERISFSLGADVTRIRWGIEQARKAAPKHRTPLSLGAYVSVCVDDDAGVAAEMVRPSVGTFAHFSGMDESSVALAPSEDREIYRALGQDYDRVRHGRGDSRHAKRLPFDFIERFAIIGSPDSCYQRLQAMLETGLDRLVIIGPNVEEFGARARMARRRFVSEVLPALRRLA